MELAELLALDLIDPQQWDELWAHCPDATLFQSRAWMQAWARIFVDQPDSLKLIAAFDGARLVGLAPLVRGERSARVTRRDAWLPLGDDYSDYQPFLAWGGSQSVVDALLDGIDRFLPEGESVHLYDVPQFSALGLNLERRARAAGAIRAGDWVACPALAVRPNRDGVARVLAKDSLNRHERALRRMGEVTVEHITDPGVIAPLLADFFEQHVARRAQTPHPSLFRNPLNRRFYEAVAATPDSGVLYSMVRLNDRVVAQHFGLRSRDSLLWYKPTFDIALRRASPGEVLLKALVEHAAALNLRELDFTRGDESFKSRFASRVAYNRHFIWHRRGADRLKVQLLQAVKGAVQRVRSTPEEASETLGGNASSSVEGRRVLLVAADEPTAACFAASLPDCTIERADSAPASSVAGHYSMVVSCTRDQPLTDSEPGTLAVASFAIQGQVTRVFVQAPAESADEIVHAVGCALRDRDWNGFAAVTVRIGRGVLPAIVRVDGQVNRSIADAAQAGVDIPRAMLQSALGERVGPQQADTSVRS
jgi:CelD/BcsL family acetyltransferase involved in cellulose biosynthesis